MDARPWQQRVRALDSNRSQQVLEDRGARGSGESLQDAGGGVDGDGGAAGQGGCMYKLVVRYKL